MTPFVQYRKATGDVVVSGTSFDPHLLEDEEFGVIVGSKYTLLENLYVFEGVVLQKPERPSAFHEWDYPSRSWVSRQEGIDRAREAKLREVDRLRKEASEAPISYSGSEFDADATAQSNVMAWMVNISNDLPVPEGFAWRDANNVDHPADAAFISGLGAAMVQRGSHLYRLAWQQKSSISALTSLSEIEGFPISF